MSSTGFFLSFPINVYWVTCHLVSQNLYKFFISNVSSYQYNIKIALIQILEDPGSFFQTFI